MRAPHAPEETQPDLVELLAEVRRIDVQSRRVVRGALVGGYVSAFRGAGLSFDTVREYADGDDPRHVDWNVTARMGRPFVKTYVEERDLTVLFLLDLSPSMGGGFGLWSARQTAARVVACLALAAVRNGDRVGLVAFGERVESHAPPSRGRGHALRIVRDCLALTSRTTHSDPSAALAFATRTVRRQAVVVLISDFLLPPARYERALTHAARRHDVVAVRVSLPEAHAPALGLVRVEDPESGARAVLDLSSPRVRAAYEARIAAAQHATHECLLRARVDLVDIPVPRHPGRDLVAGPLLRFFRMREERGRKR